MNSTNFIVEDEAFNLGGGLGTGTTINVEEDIGQIELGGNMAAPPPPAPGGGGPPPTPPSPPPPPTPTPADNVPPVISGIEVVNRTPSSVGIHWLTDELATSAVVYGLTVSYELGVVSTSTLVRERTIALGGLTPGTPYHFQVRSRDGAGNEARSADQDFTTPTPGDVVPPVISGVLIDSITDHGARVRWNTDEPATSFVDYGRTEAYELGTVRNASLLREHLASLTSLASQTTYHVRVRSADANGNESASGDQTFTTLRDTEPPGNVGDLRAIPQSFSVDLSWSNPADPDLAAISIVRRTDRFPENSGDGSLVYRGRGEQASDTGLAPDLDYFYAAFARDTTGNVSSGALARTHTLPATPGEPLPPPPPPPPPPAEPAVPVPSPTVGVGERLSLSVVRFLLSSRTLPATLMGNQIALLPGSGVGIVVPLTALPKVAARAVVNIGVNSYQLVRNDAQQIFEADVSAPAVPGVVSGALIISYEDGTNDVLVFAVAVQPFGGIVEDVDGRSVAVADALVTLLDSSAGLTPWDGSRYRAANPVQTGVGGAYGFLVPPGTYAVHVEKSGYVTAQSVRFASYGNVVNVPVRIVRLPLSPLKAIKPDAPLAENTFRVLESIGRDIGSGVRATPQIIRRVVDNPTVEKTAQNVAAPVAVGVGIATAAAGAAGAAPLLSLGTLLRALITQPFLLLARRRRKQWGVVYHALLKLPIDLAVVRLTDAQNNRVVQSQVTDAEGRFAFIVPPGMYRIEATKPGFIFPTTFLKEKNEDADFADLYHGEPITVQAAGTTITPNVPLDPQEKTETPRAVIRRNLIRSVQYVLALTGVVMSLASLIITPSWFTGIFFVVQVLLFEFFRRVARGRKPKGWGIVYDTATHKPLRFAFARIFDTQFNKLLDTRVTDASGRYTFLVGRNRFRVTFDRQGYASDERMIDATTEKQKIITERIGLNPGDVAATQTPPTPSAPPSPPPTPEPPVQQTESPPPPPPRAPPLSPPTDPTSL